MFVFYVIFVVESGRKIDSSLEKYQLFFWGGNPSVGLAKFNATAQKQFYLNTSALDLIIK